MDTYDEADEAEKFESYLSLKRKRPCTPETVRTYQHGRKLFRRWLAGREPITTSPDPFIADQLRRLAPHTASNRLFAVRAFYDFLGVSPNPTAEIHVVRPQTPPLPAVSLADQQRLIFRTGNERDRAMWLILIDTGMRIGELTAMQVGDINWSEAAIRVRGKGRKFREAWLGAETIGLLRGIVGARNSGPVWLTSQGIHKGEAMSRDRARKNFDRLAKAAGVSCHPHQLRATFANRFLKAGGDLGALREAMGHSNVAQTLHYAGAEEKDRAREMSLRLGLAGQVLHDGKVVDFDAARAARQA